MRWSHALVAAMFVLAVAACSSPATSSSGPDGGGSSQTPASQGTPASQAAPPSQGGGDGGGDVDEIFNALIPPSSTETSKTTIGGAISASYTSTDSVESLVSHYTSAIPATGMEVFSTSTAQGSTSWLFGADEGSSFGGSVTVAPDTSGSGSAQVIVIITGE